LKFGLFGRKRKKEDESASEDTGKDSEIVDEVKLYVEAAKQRDAGKKIARIPRRMLRKLGIEDGSYVEIRSSRGVTVAQAWSAYPEDELYDRVRLDGSVRETLQVRIGEVVSIRRVDLQPAKRIVFAPLRRDDIPYTEEGILNIAKYIKRELLMRPLARYDIVKIGDTFFTLPTLIVVDIYPSPYAYIDESTEVIVERKSFAEIAASSLPDELRHEFELRFNEFMSRYSQVSKVLIEVYEKTRGVIPPEIRVEAPGIRLAFVNGELCVKITEGNVYKYISLKTYVTELEETIKKDMYPSHMIYEDMTSLLDDIPIILRTAIEKIDEEIGKLDKRLKTIRNIINALEQRQR